MQRFGISKLTNSRPIMFLRANIKTHLIGFSFQFIFSSVLVALIFWTSSGYKDGVELEQFLYGLIKSDETVSGIIKPEYLVTRSIGLLSKNTIFAAGYYKQAGDDGWPGRYLYVFEPRDPNVLDKIAQRPGGYAQVFRVEFDMLANDGSADWERIFGEYQLLDIDGDGREEFIAHLSTSYADRVSKTFIVLDKEGEFWKAISLPDPEDLLSAYLKTSGFGLYIDYDTFTINSEHRALYLLSNGGDFFILPRNEGEGSNIVAVIYFADGNSTIGDHFYALLMFRYGPEGLKLDKDWNWGKPLIGDHPKNLTDDDIVKCIKKGYAAHNTENLHFGIGPGIGAINR